LGNIGETYSQLGNYTRSLDAFERARRLLGSLDASVDEHDILLDIASTYLALNLYPEALAAYREADKLVENDNTRFERARGLWAMGATLIACSRFDEAEETLSKAAASFAAVSNVPMLSSVMLEQASLLAERGNRVEALTKASHALKIVSKGDWPVQQIYARLRLADLSLEAADAEPHLLAARQLANRLALPQLRYRLNERLGHLRRLQGRNEEARALLETAVDEIERQRGEVVQDTMRVSFLRDKTAAYADLLLLHLDRQNDEGAIDAFIVAERAKSRALVDLLTGVAESAPAASSDLELRARVQTLRADLNGVYGELLGGFEEDEHYVPIQDLHKRAVELEQEIGRLRLQASAIGHTPNPFEESVPPDEIQRQLPSDVPLLAYHVAGNEILAFVHTHGRIRVVRGLSTVDAVQRLLHKLEVQWDRFRAGHGFARRHTATLERSTRHVLAALYTELMAPLEALIEGASAVTKAIDAAPKLVILPHGLLHRVPFHALFDGDRYMLERFEVSYAPSATVYALCQERSSRDSGRALAFGVEDPSIPAANVEARAVAERIIGAETRLGEEATVATLQDEAPHCDVLHLACHGLFRADNAMFSSLKLSDGWLTAADALSLDLTGTLVTLSACESGRSEVIGGDEVLGLTRAFLGAGAATLVVSLWLVQDETTAALMEDWYGRMGAGMGRATALRAAQLAAKERHPHPYYWAPFVLIGKR
jgi:CHAT domain-containing protein